MSNLSTPPNRRSAREAVAAIHDWLNDEDYGHLLGRPVVEVFLRDDRSLCELTLDGFMVPVRLLRADAWPDGHEGGLGRALRVTVTLPGTGHIVEVGEVDVGGTRLVMWHDLRRALLRAVPTPSTLAAEAFNADMRDQYASLLGSRLVAVAQDLLGGGR